MAVSTDSRKTGIKAGMTQLAATAVLASVTGTTSETALATVTIPGGAMGTDGGLLIYTTWSYTNSANNKTLRIRLGGGSGTQFFALTQTTTNSYQGFIRIRNRGAANSQVGGSSSSGALTNSSGSSPVTASVDTSVSVSLVISGQLANDTETLTLESYEVWLLPG